MIRILIAEDQVVLRDSLVNLIDAQPDMRVVAQTGKASDAVRLCAEFCPDLVLMDVITDSAQSGISAAAQLRREYPALKIIIMTGMPEITFIDSAKKAGVNSFVYKNVKSDMLLSVIRSTYEGYESFPSHSSTSQLPDGIEFTGDEINIIRAVCSAKSRKEIAKELAMSEGTVKAYITDILNKTGYDSIMKFAIHAVANGYIMPNL